MNQLTAAQDIQIKQVTHALERVFQQFKGFVQFNFDGTRCASVNVQSAQVTVEIKREKKHE